MASAVRTPRRRRSATTSGGTLSRARRTSSCRGPILDRTSGCIASLVADLHDAGALQATEYLNVHVPTNPDTPPQMRIIRPVEEFDVTVEREGDLQL